MVPVPRVSSWEELNAYLEAQCRQRRERRLRGHTETIGERFERERVAFLPLPASPYEACESAPLTTLRSGQPNPPLLQWEVNPMQSGADRSKTAILQGIPAPRDDAEPKSKRRSDLAGTEEIARWAQFWAQRRNARLARIFG
jgi:hypothetical protein